VVTHPTLANGDTQPWGLVDASVGQLGLAPFVETQYYECRLGGGQDQVDYLAAFSRSAASVLHRKLVEAGVRWPEVLRLVALWADGRSLASARIPTIWFELDDLDIVRAGQTVPSVSVCLVPAYSPDRLLAEPPATGDLDTVEEVLAALGVARSDDLACALHQCFTRLPPGGRWIHLSVMVGRTPRAVKLYGTLPRSELADYLRRIEWCGDHEAIATALRNHTPAGVIGDDAFVDLNLENFRQPGRCSLGLAVTQQHVVSGPGRDSTNARILESWVAAGLCQPNKAEALRRWPARPEDIGTSDPAKPRPGRFVDLKLVWQADRGLSAKGYLGQQQTAGWF
jgi:hypothetical protein